ncbi:MAG: hypothetical protein J6B45_01895 [Clostridia bacterium]|nr:hypothetical protein [Clostridia bacterium]
MEQNKINYKKGVKFYRLDRRPRKTLWILNWLMHFLSSLLMKRKTKIEKIGMEKVKDIPYVLLSNHHDFADFEVNCLATYPRRVNNIATLEQHYKRAWLLRLCGLIPKRKFTTDPNLINQCEIVLNEFKAILSIYPEARYSPIGTTAIIPDSYGSLIKKLGHPVCVLLHRGNYLRSPVWNWRKKRKVKTFSTMKFILSKEDVEQKSADEIIEIVRKELEYDEYRYQKDNNIIIDEPYRAEGLHHVLYKCPGCKGENMTSFGSTLKCPDCQKEWEMTTLGELVAKNGETEFSHIPSWFEWERKCVREEIESGTYSYKGEVEVHSLPNTNKFIPLGNAILRHEPKSGFTIEGHYNGEDYKISRPVAGMYGVHIEFDYNHIHPLPCVHISLLNDSFVCFPDKNKNVVMKLLFATEELYKVEMAEREAKRAQRRLNAE